jgi:hypothetical protein
MKYAWILALALLASPAFAQAPSDDEIAAGWKICAPYETFGRTSTATPWLAGAPEGCSALREAYRKSKPAIEAKAAADKAAADKAVVNSLVQRIK